MIDQRNALIRGAHQVSTGVGICLHRRNIGSVIVISLGDGLTATGKEFSHRIRARDLYYPGFVHRMNQT